MSKSAGLGPGASGIAFSVRYEIFLAFLHYAAISVELGIIALSVVVLDPIA